MLCHRTTQAAYQIIYLQVPKPVSIGHRLCRYRYSPLNLKTNDIRVSGASSGVRTLSSRPNASWCEKAEKYDRLPSTVTTSFCSWPRPRISEPAFHLKSEPLLWCKGNQIRSRSTTLLNISNVANLTCCCKLHTVAMPQPKPTIFKRLPNNVIPKNYHLTLKPDLNAFVFEGKVVISVVVESATSQIVLNCLDLTVDGVLFRVEGGESVKPIETNFSVEEETLTLIFPDVLPLGQAILEIAFSGEINDKMKGFYRSQYNSPDGEVRYAGVTQFEATDARRCFPCWDEPAIKATFDITLYVPKNKVALSNMPVVSEQMSDDKREVRFAKTPIMSTYLVAVVVGEYDYIEDVSKDGVTVRVYTPVGKKEQGRFALQVATKVLPYYKDYFQIAYPLPKIDLIAIADFSAGAMENWGLVTYRESCLLVDSANSSAVTKQWIALTVGHELAHQWFGNLVTMEWWTHLWLNEGYASFVEFLCVEHLFPEYDIWTQFVTDTYCRALDLDCLKNSHPIEVPVGHPSEIDEIFDDISYNKGASVIRMLHKYIGDVDFRKGMHLYLTRHQYNNTFTEDLWSALEEASGKPVGEVMSTWTKQMGFPVVRVTSRQEGGDRALTLSQSKFCADGSSSENCAQWLIPVMVSTSKAPSKIVHQSVLKTSSSTVTLEGVAKEEWVKVNPGTVGYYRTQYPPDMLAQFLPAIRDKSLPPLDRLGLLDDLFALVQAGQSPTVEVLKLMEAFSDEDNYTVWSNINSCLMKLTILLSHTDFDDLYKAYARRLLAGVYAKLGWEAKKDESHLVTLLRSLVIGRLVASNDEGVVKEAQRRFAAHLAGTTLIPADLRSAVYKAVLSKGDINTYNTMIKLYKEEELHEEKDRISRALGAITDINILEKVLEFALSDEVRSQDSVFVIISVSISKHGRDLGWKFVKQHWSQLIARYQSGFLLGRLVKHTTENFATEQKAVEVEAFFRDHESPGAERTVQQSCESIRLNAAWLERDSENIRRYLTAAAQ